MSTTTREIVRLCEALPENQQAEVVDFARFLLTRQEHPDDQAWERACWPINGRCQSWKHSRAPRRRKELMSRLISAQAMNSRTRPSFWRAYAGLDTKARTAAQRAFVLFTKDPAHASLRFKKLGGFERFWSARINEQYRVVGEREGDTICFLDLDWHA